MAGAESLTLRQHAFVLDYVTNGQNGTAAARHAGYAGGNGALAAAASRMLRLPKVQKAIAAITEKAIQRSERSAIADLAECLAFNTMVKRSRVGDYLDSSGMPDVEKIKQAPAGLIKEVSVSIGKTVSGRVAAESALVANNRLIDHYEQLEEGKRSEGLFAQVLLQQPTAVVAAIARAMLAGPQVKAIDVASKVIE